MTLVSFLSQRLARTIPGEAHRLDCLASVTDLCDHAGMCGEMPKIPKRWWWTRRILPVIVVFAAGTLGVRWWWARHADAQLQAEIDRIRRHGEPLAWAEIAPAPLIPDDQNAAELYKKAFQTPLLRERPEPRSPFGSFDPYGRSFAWPHGLAGYGPPGAPLVPATGPNTATGPSAATQPATAPDLPPLPPHPPYFPPLAPYHTPTTMDANELAEARKEAEEHQRLASLRDMLDDLTADDDLRRERREEVREILHLSQGALELARKARGLQAVDWKVKLPDDGLGFLVPSTYGCRPLARMLILAALEAHDAGQDDRAVEYFLDVLHLGNSLLSVPDTIYCLTSLAIHRELCSTLEEIAPDLRVGGNPGCADEDQCRRLIRAALDTEAQFRAFHLAAMGERASVHLTMTKLRREFMHLASWTDLGGTRDSLFFSMADPVLKLDHARCLRYHTDWVRTAAKREYPAVASHCVAGGEGEDSTAFLVTHFLSSLLACPMPRATLQHFRAIAYRRMAAGALAMRLYEVEQGRRPEALNDLVPAYLPAVPADPFSADGAPIRYAPDKDKPVLYCLGPDGKDDGGAFAVGEWGEFDLEESPDLVLFLDGKRPVGKRPEVDSKSTFPFPPPPGLRGFRPTTRGAAGPSGSPPEEGQ